MQLRWILRDGLFASFCGPKAAAGTSARRPSSSSSRAAAPGHPMKRPVPNYDEEARKLFQLLNLTPEGAASEESKRVHQYRDLDCVWQHPKSGGRVFIGNATASQSRGILRTNGITHIVNCTSDMPNIYERSDASLSYFRFDIYRYMVVLDLRKSEGVLSFFKPVFDWIDSAVEEGNSVLIHCLAGAHRAGTTGVAYTMHAANLNHRTGIAAVKACRPIVDPIGDLTTLLKQLEVSRKEEVEDVVDRMVEVQATLNREQPLPDP